MGLDVRAAVLCAALTGLVAATGGGHASAAASAGATTAPSIVDPRLGAAVVSAPLTAATADEPCPAGLVALTFDDGPARGLTERLVRILMRRHVPATFFMVGSRVKTARSAARKVAKAGFVVGNHSWSHPHLTRLSDGAIRTEMRRTTSWLRRVGIAPTDLMRPPYGDINARVRSDVHALGMVPVLWDVDSDDWRGGSAREIARTILRQLRPHRSNIVLQHDGVRNSPASVAAVPTVIRVARHRGYCFTSLGPDGAMQPLPMPAEAPAPTRTHIALPFDAVATRA